MPDTPAPLVMRAMDAREAGALRYQLDNILAAIDPRVNDAIDMGDAHVLQFAQAVRRASKIAAAIEQRDANPTATRRKGVSLAKTRKPDMIEKEKWTSSPNTSTACAAT